MKRVVPFALVIGGFAAATLFFYRADASATQALSCRFPINCITNPSDACCVAAGCTDVLAAPAQCLVATTTPRIAGGPEAAANSHLVRAATCGSYVELISGDPQGRSHNHKLVSSDIGGIFGVPTDPESFWRTTDLVCPIHVPDFVTMTQLCTYGVHPIGADRSITTCLFKAQPDVSGGTAIACAASVQAVNTWCSPIFSEGVINSANAYYTASRFDDPTPSHQLWTIEVVF